MFKVINLRNNAVWRNEDGTPMLFEDGKDAELAAKWLNMCRENCWSWYTPLAHQGNSRGPRTTMLLAFGGVVDHVDVHRSDKWQVRRMVEDGDWRAREAARFDDKTYAPVPWAHHKEWIKWVADKPQCDHFVHISKAGKEFISYTPTEKDGMVDRQVRTTPSRYFAKFVAGVPSEAIREWEAIWQKESSGIDVKFATTREQIREVYVNGPDSCMKGPPSKFFVKKNAPHPAEAYASGDLAVAYIQRKHSITARCVVWPEKKLYNRFYGNDSSILHQLLVADGYKNAEFEGAKLLPIPASEFSNIQNSYLVPYLDGNAVWVKYNEDESGAVTLTLHNSNRVKPSDREQDPMRRPGNQTSGFVEFPKPYVSEKSGKTFHPNRDRALEVYVGYRKKQIWSTSEAVTDGYRCNQSGKWYSREALPPVMVILNGASFPAYFSPTVAKKKVLRNCEFFNLLCPASELVTVVVGYEPDGSCVSAQWSSLAASRYSIRRGSVYYAQWTMSLLPFSAGYPADLEYQTEVGVRLGLKKAKYPVRVTQDNAHRLLRRMTTNDKGELVIVQPEVCGSDPA